MTGSPESLNIRTTYFLGLSFLILNLPAWQGGQDQRRQFAQSTWATMAEEWKVAYGVWRAADGNLLSLSRLQVPELENGNERIVSMQ